MGRRGGQTAPFLFACPRLSIPVALPGRASAGWGSSSAELLGLRRLRRRRTNFADAERRRTSSSGGRQKPFEASRSKITRRAKWRRSEEEEAKEEEERSEKRVGVSTRATGFSSAGGIEESAWRWNRKQLHATHFTSTPDLSAPASIVPMDPPARPNLAEAGPRCARAPGARARPARPVRGARAGGGGYSGIVPAHCPALCSTRQQ
ncbi:unnamed protein product [Prorocentrum cordatum]|uniref:Uncharacterized protein n=1 Tax=Prorocentrum cordatum TaxID=2364126 RepID=A0ABN9XH25_9DINO|nr:unnamed protein product [Polarella glacialis]